MLHELLLALLGFTGDFVTDEREKLEEEDEDGGCPVGPTFRLASDLSFLDPSQRYLVGTSLVLLQLLVRHTSAAALASFYIAYQRVKDCTIARLQ
jgi:hypothetical protein